MRVGETETDPSTLAQDLANRSATDDWIPGPLAMETSPLTDDEWRELYTLRSEIEDAAAALSESTLIDPTALPTPEEFASLFDEVAELETSAVTFHEGLFEDTLHPDGPVAVAHLDGDWYQSLIVCLERIEPVLSPGGVLVIDDYEAWSGAQRAVDDFLARPEVTLEPVWKSRLHLVKPR